MFACSISKQIFFSYYRRYRDNEEDSQHFFRAFMEDMIRTCTAHHKNFTSGGDFDDLLEDIVEGNRKRSFPSLQTETRPRKKWGGKSEVPVGSTELSLSVASCNTVQEKGKRDPVKDVLKNVSRDKMAAIIF